MNDDPRWLLKQTVLDSHALQLAEHGGADGLRDEGLLDSAMSRPRNRFAYEEPTPDTFELAASYAFGIARNHPFFDGNKRTALTACAGFLLLNGLRMTAGEEVTYDVFYQLAAGELSEEELAEWLRVNTEAAA